MDRYDNYTDSFVRIDGEPNTGSTTVRVGVPLKEAVTIKKVELTDECIDKIVDAVVQKLVDRKTEPNSSEIPNNCEVKNYCDDCLYADTCDSKEFFYACTSKATISKMEQVDKDINVRSKDEPQKDCNGCKFVGTYDTEFPCANCSRKTKDYYANDEPQTERSE